MSTYNYAPGAVHLDFHHNNISMSASSITDLVRSFISDRAEDITPSEDSSFASDNLSDISNSIIFTKIALRIFFTWFNVFLLQSLTFTFFLLTKQADYENYRFVTLSLCHFVTSSKFG